MSLFCYDTEYFTCPVQLLGSLYLPPNCVLCWPLYLPDKTLLSVSVVLHVRYANEAIAPQNQQYDFSTGV